MSTFFIMFLAITSIMSMIMIKIPALTVFMAIVWGSTLIISGIYLNKGQSFIIYIINILLIYYFAGNSRVFFYAVLFGSAAYVMSSLVSSGEGYYKMQRWGMITAILGVSLVLAMLYYGSGSIGITAIENQIKDQVKTVINEPQTLKVIELYEKEGIMTKADFQQILDTLAEKTARHFPAFFYLQAIAMVFIMLLLASLIAVKYIGDYFRKKPFAEEIMPWQIAWVVIIGLGLWLWGRDQLSNIYYIGSNLLLIVIPIAIYYGISFVIYNIKKRKPEKRKWMYMIVIILTLIFPLSAAIFLGLLGLFDSLIDYRKIRLSEPE